MFAVSLDITYPGGGAANLVEDQGPDAAALASSALWLVVGRFDPHDAVGYQDLARGLVRVADDFLLEADINPDRLSQIRIVFADMHSTRGEGDSVVSRIGAWTFTIADIITELVGSDIDNPDEDSLAGRYRESTIPKFYIYFSTETQVYTSAAPWARTATVSLR